MAQATVQAIPTVPNLTQQTNCATCLTRDCPLVGVVESPVQACATYRQANCYLCTQANCSLRGAMDSPVMMCAQFAPIAIA